MEENKTTSQLNKDRLFWGLIVILIAAGAFANYHFREVAWSIRLAVWIVLVGVLLGLAYLTTQGKRFWIFVQNAKIELYKVVWPTRDETIKTTAVVAALVFAMSLLLWALDSSLLWLVSWFTR